MPAGGSDKNGEVRRVAISASCGRGRQGGTTLGPFRDSRGTKANEGITRRHRLEDRSFDMRRPT